MVVSSSTWEAEIACEFRTSLVYITSSILAKAI